MCALSNIYFIVCRFLDANAADSEKFAYVPFGAGIRMYGVCVCVCVCVCMCRVCVCIAYETEKLFLQKTSRFVYS